MKIAAPSGNAICARLIPIIVQSVYAMNIKIKIPQWGKEFL